MAETCHYLSLLHGLQDDLLQSCGLLLISGNPCEHTHTQTVWAQHIISTKPLFRLNVTSMFTGITMEQVNQDIQQFTLFFVNKRWLLKPKYSSNQLTNKANGFKRLFCYVECLKWQAILFYNNYNAIIKTQIWLCLFFYFLLPTLVNHLIKMVEHLVLVLALALLLG